MHTLWYSCDENDGLYSDDERNVRGSMPAVVRLGSERKGRYSMGVVAYRWAAMGLRWAVEQSWGGRGGVVVVEGRGWWIV